MSAATQRGLKLATLLRKYHPDFPMNGMAAFSMIAADEGVCAKDIHEALETPKATVSRNLRMLGEYHAQTKPGLGLIREEVDEKDRRVKRFYLTEKGKVFAWELHTVLGEPAPSWQ